MQTIEIETEIDENHEIHLKLPNHVSGPAKVIIMLKGGSTAPPKPIELGLFRGKISMAEDFDQPLSDGFWLDGKP